MIRIIGKRVSGKSTKIIQMAIRDDATVVVPTIRHMHFMQDLAIRLGYGKQLKCTPVFYWIKNGIDIYNRGLEKELYYIDELDECLWQMGVCGYSNTEEENT